MTNEYETETLGYALLTALAGVDTWDINLRDHPDAWKVVEQFAEKLQSAAYAEGRQDEAKAWPVPYVELKDAFFWCMGNMTSFANMEIRESPSNGVFSVAQKLTAVKS